LPSTIRPHAACVPLVAPLSFAAPFAGPLTGPRSTLLCAVLALAGCGGGGGSSATDPAPPPDAGIPAAATVSLQSTPAAAEALVRDAEQRTRDLRLASGLTAGAVAGAGALSSPSSAAPRRHALAVQDYTGPLCSSGSASLDIADALLARFTADPNATLQAGDAIGLTTNHCVVKAAVDLGSVALGDFGVGSTVDGSFVLTLEQRSGNDLLFSLAYTAFSYTPYGGTAFEALDATLQFGTVGGQAIYSLDIPGTRFLAAPVVSATGNSVVVASGSLRGLAPATAGSGYADYSYSGWNFDAGLLRASGGTVTVLGAAATRAQITATPTGYTVDMTAAGVTTRYAVGR
jgi:hypothetical protein